mmetsp:Transcript_15807/g.39602  ORF Transcript_15807/g.39602 Transcript_15807/m.39602 type:complete len:203 (-) Transcript_15807:417-1025(-)
MAVHHLGRAEYQQPASFQFDARISDVLQDGVELGEPLPKGPPFRDALAHERQRALRLTNDAHAVVNPPGTEPALTDLEPSAFSQKNILEGNAHIVELYLHMALGRVVIPESLQGAEQRDAGGVHRHENLALLPVKRSLRVRLAHEDHDLAVERACAGDPPLAPIDHVLSCCAVTLDRDPDVGGVATGHRRLCHREAAANPPF